MNGHTHVLFGATSLALANTLTPIIEPHLWHATPTGATLCLGAAIVGALLPDIDANESTIKGELGFAGRVVSGGLHLLGVKHRGLTHTGLAGAVMLIVGRLIGRHFGFPDVGLAFGLGYLSHLLADGMTLTGIPLLAPFYPKSVHLLPKVLRVRTGSPVESLVFLCVSFVLAWQLPGLFASETAWIQQCLP